MTSEVSFRRFPKRFSVKNPASPKILIVGASWVGDMVMAQSLFITLKQQYPDCQIDVLAPRWTFALLDRMPEVSDAIEMPLGHGKLGLGERIRLGKKLRAHQYDRAFVLPNSLKSAITPFFANIPLRIGYVGECRWGLLNDARKLDKTLLKKTVQRFVALAYPKDFQQVPNCPVPFFQIDSTRQRQVIDKFELDVGEKVLALCPGAEYGPAKRWPAAHFAELASHYLQQGWQVWLFGSEKDKEVAAEINGLAAGRCVDFSGKTSIAEAVDLMSLADTVISNDSGLMHVAAALNKRLVAIYGSSDPNFTPPLNDEASIISLGLECSPCFKRGCPLGHTRCLGDISPQSVIDKIG